MDKINHRVAIRTQVFLNVLLIYVRLMFFFLLVSGLHHSSPVPNVCGLTDESYTSSKHLKACHVFQPSPMGTWQKSYELRSSLAENVSVSSISTTSKMIIQKWSAQCFLLLLGCLQVVFSWATPRQYRCIKPFFCLFWQRIYRSALGIVDTWSADMFPTLVILNTSDFRMHAVWQPFQFTSLLRTLTTKILLSLKEHS